MKNLSIAALTSVATHDAVIKANNYHWLALGDYVTNEQLAKKLAEFETIVEDGEPTTYGWELLSRNVGQVEILAHAFWGDSTARYVLERVTLPHAYGMWQVVQVGW